MSVLRKRDRSFLQPRAVPRPTVEDDPIRPRKLISHRFLTILFDIVFDFNWASSQGLFVIRVAKVPGPGG